MIKTLLLFLLLFQINFCKNTFFEVKSDHLLIKNALILEYEKKEKKEELNFKLKKVDLSKLINPEDIKLIKGKFGIPVQKLSNIKGISLLKELCSGHCAFEIELYIENKSKIDNTLFLYSSTKIEAVDTPYLVNLKNFKEKTWFHLDLWVPDYLPLKGNGIDFQISNPNDLRIINRTSPLSIRSRNLFAKFKSLSSQKNIFIHSISIKKSKLNVLNIEEQKVLQKAFKFFPSHFENSFSMILLVLFFILFTLFFSIKVKKKIGLKILLGFFIPIIFSITFLSVQGLSDFLSLIETSELYEVQRKLHMETLQINNLGEFIENDFMFKIEKKIIPSLKKVIKKFKKNKINLEINKYGEYRVKRVNFKKDYPNRIYKSIPSTFTKENTLDLALSEICSSYGLSLMIANGTTIFFSDDFYSYRGIRHVSSIFQKYVQNEFTKKRTDLSGEKALKGMRELMSKGLDDTKVLDKFMNNPSHLFGLHKRTLDSTRYASKTFWTYLIEKEFSKDLVWFVFGGVGSKILMKNLEKRLNKLFKSKNHFSDDYLFFGDNLNETFSSEKKYNNQMFEIAALAKRNLSLVFLPKIYKNQLYFYSYHNYKYNIAYSFVLKKLGNGYLKKIQRSKNNIYYSIYILFFLIFIFSYLLSFVVTTPMYLLSQGMQKIKEGDLRNDLVSKGKDQFNDVTQLLNYVLSSLREKEHLSKFLSNMVLNSLDSEKNESSRQEQYVLFCGIQNLKDLEKSIGLEKVVSLIDTFLQVVQKSIVNHDGRIDKFTGKSSLSVFSVNISSETMIHLLLEIKEKLNIYNLSNKENISVKFGLGLARGFVVLGHVGSSQRKDFTAIGSTVNKAARLEALASQTNDLMNVYFDQTCFNDFKSIQNLNYKICESVYLKGYKKEQEVYELL
ncbi:MAG: hypothetical protein COB02_06100 [Candidatus Cloacimonadota bacterium]|nr:MAG: hypothetical protein COB02_06100 [Candidatus Cloacimonadota bacterium]